MLGPLNQHIGRKLASFILAFGLACTFQPIPASASNDNKSCQPSIPRDLLPSEFEELREKILSSGRKGPLKLSFKPNFDLGRNPFVHLLSSVRQIDSGRFMNSIITLEGFEINSHRGDFCQNSFLGEISSTLRYATVKNLISQNPRNSGMWNGFGAGALSLFTISNYETARCIVMNIKVDALKLDRELTFEDYPRHCVVH